MIAVIFRNIPAVPPPPPVVPPPVPVVSLSPALAIALVRSEEESRPTEELPIVPPTPDSGRVVVVTAPLALSRRLDPAAVLTQQVGGTDAVGAISGTLFADLNGDGIFGPDKPPLAGRLVFLDLNNNGILDDGEPVTVTNSNGEYTFSGLPLQTYQVRQLLPRGDVQTLPAESQPWEVRLDNSRHDAGGRNFGNLNVPLRATPAPVPATPGTSGDRPTGPPSNSDEDDGGDQTDDGE